MNGNGTRGPGALGAPDLVERLGKAAGGYPDQRGLYLPNYYVPVPGEGERGEAEPPVPPEWRWLVEYAVELLMRKLRFANPGINVRLPSHHAAPFRAIMWTFETDAEVLSGAPLNATVEFNGQAVVPEGVRGVVADLGFWVYPTDLDNIVDDPLDAAFTLTRQGLAVPGLLDIRPGVVVGEQITDAGGSDDVWAAITSPRIVAPVSIEPGDVLAVRVTRTSLQPLRAVVRLQGYLYPIEVEGDGIVGTMADRGGAIE